MSLPTYRLLVKSITIPCVIFMTVGCSSTKPTDYVEFTQEQYKECVWEYTSKLSEFGYQTHYLDMKGLHDFKIEYQHGNQFLMSFDYLGSEERKTVKVPCKVRESINPYTY